MVFHKALRKTNYCQSSCHPKKRESLHRWLQASLGVNELYRDRQPLTDIAVVAGVNQMNDHYVKRDNDDHQW